MSAFAQISAHTDLMHSRIRLRGEIGHVQRLQLVTAAQHAARTSAMRRQPQQAASVPNSRAEVADAGAPHYEASEPSTRQAAETASAAAEESRRQP